MNRKRSGMAAAFLLPAIWLVFWFSAPAPGEPEISRKTASSRPGSASGDSRLGAGEHDDGGRGHEREDHGEERLVRLSAEELEEFGIELAVAGPGRLETEVSLPGEVALNADRLAHVVPRVSGIVREVRRTLGDRVRKGDVLAVLESRDLADSKADFLAARERVSMAEANFLREEGLWKKKISSEQEYLEARRAFAEARISLRSAEQKLHALGFSEKDLARLPGEPDVDFTRYEMVAPFDGTVIEKHIVLGEVLKDDAEAYVVADLSSVWINISVYQKDLPRIRRGLPVIVSAGHGVPDAGGTISYLGPLVGEETRTALARVVLPDARGLWRPGLFVTARVIVQAETVPIAVPRTALQTLKERPHVFVETEEGLLAVPVALGRTNHRRVEIVSGLEAGRRYVKTGAFTLKAQLSKGAFGGGHGH